ncbi:Glutathione S-transferase domain protein [Gloeothece citriformis PCC 7424]|uniref:Glutathione S-transferase domain protein n=1 Tax=Gloeothece citriformis (strain PCC 7424) TaxID=65393 RepID=B7KGJ6_GLOC7|nr:glutathione S-transferase family protein [Gloeothece citriformis]ACK71923.1 Glutathione S-transferase domain protein [Gloeothece citriformis PCC 7424]
MLKLYHTPVSPNSHRVWVTLIEKGLEFELVEVNLTGEQFKPEFLAMNPFHHIPVLVDDDNTIIESLAILDYLEAKYPTPAMLPDNPKDLSTVRMVQLVTVNELLPSASPLFPVMLGLSKGDEEKIKQAKEKVGTIFKFFESLLDERPFFGSETITLADAVAGTVVPWLPRAGVPLTDYSKLNRWCDRILSRPAWEQTKATPEAMEQIKSAMAARMSS